MQITEVNFQTAENDQEVLAYVDITFDDRFRVYGIRLIRRKDKETKEPYYLVVMPQRHASGVNCPVCYHRSEKRWRFCSHCGRKLSNNMLEGKRFFEIAHPLDASTRAMIEQAIIAAYEAREHCPTPRMGDTQEDVG